MKQAKIAELPQQIMDLMELKQHPKNPNKHPDSQIATLRHLIRTHGYYAVSITIQKSTNTIIKGHGVREALLAEGYDKALVSVKDCDDAEALAILIADNKIASDSIIDDISLQNAINELSEMDVPALDFAFDEDDLSELADRILGDNPNESDNSDNDDDWETMSFRVPIECVDIINSEIDRLLDIMDMDKKTPEDVRRGLALEKMAVLSAETPTESLI